MKKQSNLDITFKTAMTVIEAQHLSMQFGSLKALKDVSFQIQKGEVVGLLGPNGAGKTTAMRILTTYLVPTSGTANIAGFDIQKQPIEVRRRVGYLPETSPLYLDMEVREYLRFVGKGRSLDSTKLKSQIDFILQACELKSVFRRPIIELSKGYRQRVGLAQALIHDPEILILDEPTSGLDPIQILGIRKLLNDLVTNGKTIIFSTHILQEVVAVTARVIIINEGKIVADGTIDEISLKAEKGKKVVVIIASASPDIQKELSDIGATVSSENGSLKAEFAGRTGLEIFEELKERDWPVSEIREERPTFEDAFIQLIREGKK